MVGGGGGGLAIFGRKKWPFSPKNGRFFCFLPYLLIKFPKKNPAKMAFLAYFFENLAVFLLFGIFGLGIFFCQGGDRGGKIDRLEPGRG